jgi:hypothetical protein
MQGTFKIIGLAPRSYKMPILASDKRGKVYKFPAESVVRKLYPQNPFTPPADAGETGVWGMQLEGK